MKIYNLRLIVIVILLCSILISCEDFLEIETPNHKMVSDVVYNNDATAISVMQGIYNQLAMAPFSNGGPESVTVLAGLSADALTTIRTDNLPYIEFDTHHILPSNFRNNTFWASFYNVVYMANSLLEGLNNSEGLTEEVRNRLEGEAKFVRAFTYFYLVNLYGDVPLLLTSDYRFNALAPKNTAGEIYLQINLDLREAVDVLENEITDNDRTKITRNVAIAFLARVELYLQNWNEAEILSSEVISETSSYEILEELDQVYSANSKEAIWQISPGGRGQVLTNTREGSVLIIHPTVPSLSHLKLSDNFIASFETEDVRLHSWIDFHEGTQSFYSFKYKIRNSTDPISEYSMVLRLAEQFLIRAEARAMLGDFTGAISDLDKIRERAGLESVSDIYPDVDKALLLFLISEERKKELFTEWGHRWLDLKRTGKVGEYLNTDLVYYPIPEQELLRNPNLTQSNGY